MGHQRAETLGLLGQVPRDLPVVRSIRAVAEQHPVEVGLLMHPAELGDVLRLEGRAGPLLDLGERGRADEADEFDGAADRRVEWHDDHLCPG
jgi:hypothetical protein